VAGLPIPHGVLFERHRLHDFDGWRHLV